MNERWNAFLSAAAAGQDAGSSLADPGAAVLCDLSQYGLIAFDGPEAVAFLHGQLSSDVQALSEAGCQLGAYHSPKGRVLAILLLWLSADGVLAQVPAALAEPVRKRLAMYILRAKVRASLATERYVRLGLGGPGAAAVLERLGLAYPPADMGIHRAQAVTLPTGTIEIAYLLRLPGHRYELLLTDAEAAIALWQALVQHGAMPAGATAWRWLSVRSGIPEIGSETQDQFVAQMLNLELVGAVSFSKGCYPGQEIVARAQYRGEIKRRTLLLHADAEREPAPGDTILAPETAGGQAVGSVLMAAPAPAGGVDLLACLHVDLARPGGLRLGGPDGPDVQPLALPYKLPLAA